MTVGVVVGYGYIRMRLRSGARFLTLVSETAPWEM